MPQPHTLGQEQGAPGPHIHSSIPPDVWDSFKDEIEELYCGRNDPKLEEIRQLMNQKHLFFASYVLQSFFPSQMLIMSQA
jgi:Clr5 domain